MINDTLSNALSKIDNAERTGKTEIVITPASHQMKAVFEILKKEKYIKDFDITKNKRGGQATVKLAKLINKIGAIKPRFSVKLADSEKFEKRYLPAKGFGCLIISTPQGMMTHIEAQKKKLGGVLIAYVY